MTAVRRILRPPGVRLEPEPVAAAARARRAHGPHRRRAARSRSSRASSGIIAVDPGVRAPAVVRRLLPDRPVRVPVLVPVAAAQVHGHAGRPADRHVVRRTTAASRTCSSTPRRRSASCAASRSSSCAAARCRKGMLLSGAPGTGKTFLAACIAAEANLPFIYIDASSLRGMFMGMTELMIMKLFRDARGLGPQVRPGRAARRLHRVHGRDRLDRHEPRRPEQRRHDDGRDDDGRRDHGPEHPAQPDGLARRARRGPLALQDPALVRARPRPGRRTSRSSSSSARRTGPRCSIRRSIRPGRLDRMLVVHEPDADGRRDIIEPLPVEEAARPRHARWTCWSPTRWAGPRS